jgi:hypothetical protein
MFERTTSGNLSRQDAKRAKKDSQVFSEPCSSAAKRLSRNPRKRSDVMLSGSEASRIFKVIRRRDSSPEAQNDIAPESKNVGRMKEGVAAANFRIEILSLCGDTSCLER